MKRGAPTVSTRSGNVEFLKLNISRWEWRDVYHWTLTLTWPQFMLFLLGAYLGVNALFAGLYLLGGGQIAEMRPGSFQDAFFFSVETLATVGYGHMYPLGLGAHLVATTEIVLGMFGMAVVTGLIFVRFSRPAASLRFSTTMALCTFDGDAALMIRVANQRLQPMVDAEFRLMMIRTEDTIEETGLARFYDLPLQTSRVVIFPAAMTIRHIIDEHSPLHGLTPESLAGHHTRFVAAAACVDTVVAASVQSHQHYTWRDVRFGERFVEIYSEQEDGRFLVDYARLHETEPAVERSAE